MPTTFAIKALADGQLAASKGELYPCPSGKTTTVRSITVVNTSTGSVIKVNMYLQRDGTNSRRIWPRDLELQPQYMLVDNTVYTLEAGDLIEGDAGTAGVVDFTISGWEEG